MPYFSVSYATCWYIHADTCTCMHHACILVFGACMYMHLRTYVWF